MGHKRYRKFIKPVAGTSKESRETASHNQSLIPPVSPPSSFQFLSAIPKASRSSRVDNEYFFSLLEVTNGFWEGKKNREKERKRMREKGEKRRDLRAKNKKKWKRQWPPFSNGYSLTRVPLVDEGLHRHNFSFDRTSSMFTTIDKGKTDKREGCK